MLQRNTLWVIVIITIILGLVVGILNLKNQPIFPPVAIERIQESPATPVSQDVRVVSDIPYTSTVGNNPKQRLDLYLPAKDYYPVVMFIHGGSWKSGDKAMYSGIGRFLANAGIGAVIPSYRLPPEVECNGEMQDVTKAFTWAYTTIGRYGGRMDRIFLAGHSSGAHLASLMATDEGWLSAEGLTTKNIKGVVAISGVYNLGWNVRLGGAQEAFAGLNKTDYSPAQHVSGNMPPFLIMYAENDYRTLPRQSKDFYGKLSKVGVKSKLYVIPNEDHVGIIVNLVKPGAPQGKNLVEWVKTTD